MTSGVTPTAFSAENAMARNAAEARKSPDDRKNLVATGAGNEPSARDGSQDHAPPSTAP